MKKIEDWKEELNKFLGKKENLELLDNNQFKELFIRAIEYGIPFDVLAKLLVKSNINVNIQQIKDELYLLAIKILKNWIVLY